jgi:hypothetical protein
MGTGLVFSALLGMASVFGLPCGAAQTQSSTAPPYSAKVGRVPLSQQVRHTFHVSNDTTVRPPPKRTRVVVSQLAAIGGHEPAPETNVNGELVYPTVLLGVLTNSVIQPACELPGLQLPGPAATAPCPHTGLTYQQVLVWVVEYRGVYPRASGGPTPRPDESTTSTIPVTTTTLIPLHSGTFTYVSATTGGYLYGEG